jgi:hypothetical protein
VGERNVRPPTGMAEAVAKRPGEGSPPLKRRAGIIASLRDARAYQPPEFGEWIKSSSVCAFDGMVRCCRMAGGA